MKLIYAAALATALTVPSLAKASVVGLADVNLPNNLVDFLVTDENEPDFSFEALLSPTTFIISTTEASQTPIALVIEDFYEDPGGANILQVDEDTLGGTATGGPWLIDGGEFQQASGNFASTGFDGVVAFDEDDESSLSTKDLIFVFPLGPLSSEEVPAPKKLF